MTRGLKLTLAAGIASGGLALAANSAAAMPRSGIDPGVAAPSDIAANAEHVRWVCGPYGCYHVPGWRRYWGRPYGYWGGPAWRYRYGYHPWRHYGWGPYAWGGSYW
jgi:hypothetical protein